MMIEDLKVQMDRGFADVHAQLAWVKDDVAVLKNDVAGLKDDVAGLKTDVAGLKTDVAGIKEDIGGLKVESVSLRDYVVEEGRATRRHMDVCVEAFRAENRLALDQIAALSGASSENLRVHGSMTGILDDHEIRLKALEAR